jgi:regulator of extracellular matrix RemA (YlzA/DUF370 family)
MLADPQTVTINAVDQVLPRTSSGKDTATYTKDDGTVIETVSHQYGKRTRRVIRLDQNKIAADSLNPSLNTKSSMGVYLVLDIPTLGFTVTEQTYLAKALLAYLAASSYAALVAFIGGQS